MNKLVFGDIVLSKGNFYENKKGIMLKDINVNKIVVSNKIKVNDETDKVFIGYIMDNDVTRLILLLLQMSGWIRYFENGEKNMSFKIDEDLIYLKYNEIWNKT